MALSKFQVTSEMNSGDDKELISPSQQAEEKVGGLMLGRFIGFEFILCIQFHLYLVTSFSSASNNFQQRGTMVH